MAKKPRKLNSILDLRLDDRNANAGTERGIEMVKDSLSAYGAGRSILADRNGVIIAGNKTLSQAMELDLPIRVVETTGKELIVHQRTDLDIREKAGRELSIADNRSSQVGLNFDFTVLREHLEAGVADLKKFWNEDELNALLAGVTPVEVPGEDPGPGEIPEEPKCRAGDLWTMGAHRLLCGDSTCITDVERVMDGEKAALCFTSPPYAEQREYDKTTKQLSWQELMEGVFSILPMAEAGQVLVNLGLVHRDGEWVPYWDAWIQFMRDAGWKRFGWYVWDQGFGLPGDWNGRFAPSHEFIFHFNRTTTRPMKSVNKKPESIKLRKEGSSTMRSKDGICKKFSSPEASAQLKKISDSVIRINRMHGGHKIEHPAVFPVELPIFIFQAWDSALVFDPFLGSGTTMIAAEKTGRRCFGIEISEKYCSVILNRWAKMTEKDPVRHDGRRWSEVKAG